ncbi:rhodanese-like domain-containing protein [Pseudalkalibacillus caeni]|uniref:Rhodanese-like domain-containing protein n=1 Tax=Exobacillus caeni TaxID=2574798 RepID=A0A5R9F8A1_9BACL|nr:rhodanese-like domain-containing protein [Pseudalkalibacillus caeni]TLS38749.1 rhodanese-like domain-containing protein [Pseudalkalibacillus caeni]
MSEKRVEDINPETVEKRLQDNEQFQLIDVRETNEYEEGHIPGIKLIPLSDFENRYQEIDPAKEVVMVCRSGGRSGKASDFLAANGYENVKNMVGGMLAWNGEVERG